MAPNRLEERLQAVVASPTPYEVVHKTRYRVHERVAEHFVCGKSCLRAMPPISTIRSAEWE